MNATAADRFWRNDDADARTWEAGISPAEWRRLCRGSYQRKDSELLETFDDLMLVTHDESRSSGFVENPPYAMLSHTWVAVRGTDYAPASTWNLEPGAAREIVVDLVPTPLNPHDPFAVAVEWEGKKLGNVSRGYAAHAHRKLRILNLTGYRTTTAAVVRAFYRDEIGEPTPEGFIALPTFKRLDSFLPPFETNVETFRPLWDALSSQIKQKIIEDEYHLSERTIRAVLMAGLEFPELVLHPKTDLHNFPVEFDYVLRDVRQADVRARRAVREAEKESQWKRDCDAVIELVAAGLTRHQMRAKLGLSENRLRTILVETGLNSSVARVAR